MADDRCVLCGGVFADAPEADAEIEPALTDAELTEALDAVATGNHEALAWFDAQWFCADCTQDVKTLVTSGVASLWEQGRDRILDRRRARQHEEDDDADDNE